MDPPIPPPRPSKDSSYLALLNSLAWDLDYMLNDLCPSPPPVASHTQIRGDGFLEPYMEGLGGDDSIKRAPSPRLSPPPPLVPPPLIHPFPTFKHVFPSSVDDCGGESSGGSNGVGSSSSVGSGSGAGPPCDIGLLERLIRTHPVWYLPGIQRAGAFHLLQGKEEGNFVVRQSSQTSTMAISVRLPQGKGPYIEHYLIQADIDGKLSLESSDNKFHSIPALIAHYSQCCDELPVQLSMPRIIREAKNRQQLTSLALLGQEFWRYPMANPRPSQLEGSNPAQQHLHQIDVVGSNAGLNSSLPSSQASSLSSFSSGNNNVTRCSPTNDPSDSIVLNLAPISDQSISSNLMSTFKGSSPTAEHNGGGSSPPPLMCDSPSGPPSFPPPRAPRPTPPNTLNLISSNSNCKNHPGGGLMTPSAHSKTPPPPPPRWSKPAASNFTVTTTVTFSMTEMTTSSASPLLQQPSSLIEVGSKVLEYHQSQKRDTDEGATTDPTSPDFLRSPLSPTSHSPSPSLTSPPTSSRSFSPLLPRKASSPLVLSHSLVSPSSSITSPSSLVSPLSESSASAKPPPHRRSKRHKESSHYQESDILESPTVYCRSSVADKVSDYEDIWGPESLTTFKPQGSVFKSPEEHPLLTTPSTQPSFSPVSPFQPVVQPQSLQEERQPIEATPGPEFAQEEPLSSNCQEAVPQEPVTKQKIPDILDRVPPCPAPRPSLQMTTTVTSPLSVESPQTPTDQSVGDQTATKQSSPFYCEPADAIRNYTGEVTRRKQSTTKLINAKNNRHSDPATLMQWPGMVYPGALERIDSKEELITSGFSSSVDNLAILKRPGRRMPDKSRAKQKHSKRPHNKKSYSENAWTVDSSWEFIGNEDENSDNNESPEERSDRKFPSLEQQETESPSKGVTVHELISQRLPDLRLPGDLSCAGREVSSKSDSSGHSGSRVSAYDNVSSHRNTNGVSTQSHISDDDTQTVFSEPWDSSRWESLLEKCDDWRADDRNSIIRNKSFKERLDPLLSGPRLQALQKTRESCTGGGATIRAYALHLAADKTTVFAQTIDNFIACTKESREARPHVVMRNMRQFMSGMKNYLVKHGEREFERHVEKERGKLRANEFLNLDAILEGVMHKLVVRPLKEHLYRLFVDEYTNSGAIQLLADNIQYARTKPLHELGIRPKIIPPSDDSLERICSFLQRLQEVDSPLEKLENLLACIAAIFNSVKVDNACLGADDFLPLFVWVLVQSGMLSAEIEAEYMWGLLHPSLLSGEGGYYLTTLSSAVQVLKSFRASLDQANNPTLPLGSGPLGEFRSVLKIVVPDEMNGSIITKTLPVRPNMTTREVCKIIAHKVRITNPQDYGLYKLIDGEETLLNDGDCPQDVKGTTSGKHCMFAYKRMDAKIAWPINTN